MKKRKQHKCGIKWLSSIDWEMVKIYLVLDVAIKAIVFSIFYICGVI
jgi:hypothetical protein